MEHKYDAVARDGRRTSSSKRSRLVFRRQRIPRSKMEALLPKSHRPLVRDEGQTKGLQSTVYCTYFNFRALDPKVPAPATLNTPATIFSKSCPNPRRPPRPNTSAAMAGSVKQRHAPGDSLLTRQRHRQTRTQLTARVTDSRIALGMPTCSEWGTPKTKNMMLCSVTTRTSFVVDTLRRIHGTVPSEAG